jgi:uncharacterized protein
MHRRLLGTTEIDVSVLGLGSSPFRAGQPEDWVHLLEAAVDRGITYFDTARTYVNGEDAVGHAPQSVKEALVVATKTGARGGTRCVEDLRMSLHHLRRSYIDVWMTHMVRDMREYDLCLELGGFCDIAHAAKQAGIIRATGASFHAPTDVIKRAILDRAFDVVMFQVNLVGRETVIGSSVAEYVSQLLPAATTHRVGVVAMKILAGGELKHGAPVLTRRLGLPSPADIIPASIRYAARLPGLSCAVVGFSNVAELDQAVAAVAEIAPDGDLAEAMARGVRAANSGECTRCGACLDVCPEDINVPKVFRLYDQFRHLGIHGVARHKYALLDIDARACTGCQECQRVCPEDFDIAALLTEAHRTLAAPNEDTRPI